MGMVCSRVDVSEPEPVIGEDTVDFGGGLNYSCSPLKLTRCRGGELPVRMKLCRVHVGELEMRRSNYFSSRGAWMRGELWIS